MLEEAQRTHTHALVIHSHFQEVYPQTSTRSRGRAELLNTGDCCVNYSLKGVQMGVRIVFNMTTWWGWLLWETGGKFALFAWLLVYSVKTKHILIPLWSHLCSSSGYPSKIWQLTHFFYATKDILNIKSYQFTPSASTQANLYSFTLSINCRQPATHWTYWELCVRNTHTYKQTYTTHTHAHTNWHAREHKTERTTQSEDERH